MGESITPELIRLLREAGSNGPARAITISGFLPSRVHAFPWITK
jgi:hypothetical protein